MCTPHLVLGGSGPGDINRFLLILLLARMAVNTWLKQNLSWCRWRQQQHRCYPAAHTFLKLIPLDILSKPSKACNFSDKIKKHLMLAGKTPKYSCQDRTSAVTRHIGVTSAVLPGNGGVSKKKKNLVYKKHYNLKHLNLLRALTPLHCRSHRDKCFWNFMSSLYVILFCNFVCNHLM